MDEASSMLHDLPILKFLSPEVRKLVVDSFVPLSFAFGSSIMREGEETDAFYVLVSGQARVIKRGEHGEEISLDVLRPGDSFGEIELFEQTTRTETVRASNDVKALKLDRSVFNALIKNSPETRRFFEVQRQHQCLRNFLRVHSPFARLPVDALRTLWTALEVVSVQRGALVLRQGEGPGPMYIIEEGRLRVFTFTEEDGQRRDLAYLRKGDFFGEMSSLKGSQCTASIEAVSPCRLLRLDQETFAKLINRYPGFKALIEDRIAQYNDQRVARVPLDFAEEMRSAEASHDKAGQEQMDQQEEDPAKISQVRLGPFATSEGYFVKKATRIHRFPHVRQIDEMDCGAASLAMVCRYFGRSVSLARIRQLVHTSIDGTSLQALCHAAAELGLAARAVKASTRSLLQMPLPAIVHWQGNHWVVLYDVDATRARIADPAIGLRRVSREAFAEKWTGYAALFDYTEAFEQAPEGRLSIRWLWPFFRPFMQITVKALALAIIVSALQMVLPVFTQVIVDKVLADQDVRLLRTLIMSMMAVLLFGILAMIVQRYLLSFAAVRMDAATLDFLIRKLLTLPMSYFNTRRTGDILRRLAGMRQVREFLVQYGVSGLTAMMQFTAALVVMFVYSPVLALIFLTMAPLYALLMRISARWLRPIFDNLEEGFGKYHSYQIDAIKGIETVKAMGAEGAFRGMLLNQFHGMARRQFEADFTIMCYQGAIQTVTSLSVVLFLWAGAHQVMQGTLTIGGLVAFNSLVSLANVPIGTLLSLWDKFQFASVLLNRLNDIFEQEPEQGADHAHLTPVRTLEGKIRFQNVGLRYGGAGSAPILEGITFEASPGTMVAIVGRSGSGKTTLIKCLAGLLEPTDGTILYDGIDLKTLNYRDLRRQIGLVLQENHLFDDTIAHNIAFGEDEPDMDQVLWAARVANAHEFIEQLPLKYDTRVGETGIALSGGQRQRIAIARALYHRPPVLIFDEATSSLDTESERAIKENMDKLLKGRTSFVVAHRLSTIREADVIVVLEKGRLVEQGTHDELMKRQGLYSYLCSQQLGF